MRMTAPCNSMTMRVDFIVSSRFHPRENLFDARARGVGEGTRARVRFRWWLNQLRGYFIFQRSKVVRRPSPLSARVCVCALIVCTRVFSGVWCCRVLRRCRLFLVERRAVNGARTPVFDVYVSTRGVFFRGKNVAFAYLSLAASMLPIIPPMPSPPNCFIASRCASRSMVCS